MIASLFTIDSPYKKKARVLALLWTLLIIAGCFAPATTFPKVEVPLADKWVHFILFGGFTFLWALTNPSCSFRRLASLFFTAVAFGCLIEVMQGQLTFLGRSMELMDAVADSIGAGLGLIAFCACVWLFAKKTSTRPIDNSTNTKA